MATLPSESRPAASAPPGVVIAGGGVAGLAAAHRLLQRGFDVTILEANAFLGGKLGAFQGPELLAEGGKVVRAPDGAGVGGGSGRDAPVGMARGAVPEAASARSPRDIDWHEHCYHMYLNWYHNFWALMQEAGTLGNFTPVPNINYLQRDDPTRCRQVLNIGSPWTALHNLRAGIGSAANTFLYFQSMADLIGTPASREEMLEQTSVLAFVTDRPYSTAAARSNIDRTLAEAFASPSYMSSSRSYKSLLKYGARLPEPSMWLLQDNTESAIFTPWLTALARMAAEFHVQGPAAAVARPAFQAALAAHAASRPGPYQVAAQVAASGRLTIRLVTRVFGLVLRDGLVEALELAEDGADKSNNNLALKDHNLILAIPPGQLARLVTPAVAALAPPLAEVRRLRCEPMISLDLYFRKPLPHVPRGITSLLDSRYKLSLLDNAQIWRDVNARGGGTMLNVIASDATTLVDWPVEDIVRLLLAELKHYLIFEDADLEASRTNLQTNVGEELFVNEVGSWQWRPTATTGIANLFIAGDFCQTPIDVVTIEGAVTSGLMAAEALRRRSRCASPIRIVEPDAYPVSVMAAYAAALRPLAMAAKGVSMAEGAIQRGFAGWFPNG